MGQKVENHCWKGNEWRLTKISYLSFACWYFAFLYLTLPTVFVVGKITYVVVKHCPGEAYLNGWAKRRQINEVKAITRNET